MSTDVHVPPQPPSQAAVAAKRHAKPTPRSKPSNPIVIRAIPRPYSEWLIYFQLERSYIYQNVLKVPPPGSAVTVGHNGQQRASFDPLDPSYLELFIGRAAASGRPPPLPRRYVGLVLPDKFYTAYKDSKVKNAHDDSVISLRELSDMISKNWESADDETKEYVRVMHLIEVEEYERRVKSREEEKEQKHARPGESPENRNDANRGSEFAAKEVAPIRLCVDAKDDEKQTPSPQEQMLNENNKRAISNAEDDKKQMMSLQKQILEQMLHENKKRVAKRATLKLYQERKRPKLLSERCQHDDTEERRVVKASTSSSSSSNIIGNAYNSEQVGGSASRTWQRGRGQVLDNAAAVANYSQNTSFPGYRTNQGDCKSSTSSAIAASSPSMEHMMQRTWGLGQSHDQVTNNATAIAVNLQATALPGPKADRGDRNGAMHSAAAARSLAIIEQIIQQSMPSNGRTPSLQPSQLLFNPQLVNSPTMIDPYMASTKRVSTPGERPPTTMPARGSDTGRAASCGCHESNRPKNDDGVSPRRPPPQGDTSYDPFIGQLASKGQVAEHDSGTTQRAEDGDPARHIVSLGSSHHTGTGSVSSRDSDVALNYSRGVPKQNEKAESLARNYHAGGADIIAYNDTDGGTERVQHDDDTPLTYREVRLLLARGARSVVEDAARSGSAGGGARPDPCREATAAAIKFLERDKFCKGQRNNERPTPSSEYSVPGPAAAAKAVIGLFHGRKSNQPGDSAVDGPSLGVDSSARPGRLGINEASNDIATVAAAATAAGLRLLPPAAFGGRGSPEEAPLGRNVGMGIVKQKGIVKPKDTEAQLRANDPGSKEKADVGPNDNAIIGHPKKTEAPALAWAANHILPQSIGLSSTPAGNEASRHWPLQHDSLNEMVKNRQILAAREARYRSFIEACIVGEAALVPKMRATPRPDIVADTIPPGRHSRDETDVANILSGIARIDQ